MIPLPNLRVVRPNSHPGWEDAEQVLQVTGRLPPETVRALSTPAPARTIGLALLDWALIAVAVVACQRFWHPVVYAITVAFIGARQHALGVLMHEGVHYRIHASKAVNEWVSDVLCAWPIGISTELYRSFRHFPHHRFIGLPDDPHRWQTYRGAWRFPMRWWLVVLLLALEAVVGSLNLAVIFVLSTLYARGHVARLARLAVMGAVVALAVRGGWARGMVLYWLIPLAVWVPVLNVFRTMAEHAGVKGPAGGDGGDGSSTRTTLAGWLAKTFLFAHNINYHVEHHLYPSVPFHRLPELHALLQERVRSGATPAYHVTRGYVRVWRELVGART
jgi:fatty acid desaturase